MGNDDDDKKKKKNKKNATSLLNAEQKCEVANVIHEDMLSEIGNNNIILILFDDN